MNSIFNEASRSGLASKFEEFRQNLEISDAQKQNIIGSHTHMRQNVLDKLDYVKTTFLTGSYKKNTMIKPPNDVDMFVVLNHSTNDITPQAALNKLKNDLKNSYPNSTIKQDKPCIVADFNQCRFELTPVIEYFENYYIPEKDSWGTTLNWKLIRGPKTLEDRLSQANSYNSGKLTPLIKMMKKCRNKNGFSMKSFELEEKAIALFQWGGIGNYREGVEKLIKTFVWSFNRYSSWDIERMSDDQFARFARETLFGNDFPA